MYWFICVERLEEFSQILYDHESVVIRFNEPVEFLSVVLVAVLERLLSFAPEILPAFTDIEGDRPELFVLLGAHEDEFITVRSPGVLNMDCPTVVIGWPGHNPTQDLEIRSRRYRSRRGSHWRIFRQYCGRWTLDFWLLK